MSLSILRSRVGCGCLVLIAAASVARATDILDEIRGDVAGVIVFRDIVGSVQKLNELGCQVSERWVPLSIPSLERSFLLEPGSCDCSKPIALVLTRPSFDPSSMVLVFTPREPKEFLESLGGEENVPVERPGPSGEECRVMMRRGLAYLCEREKPFRMIRRPAGRRTVRAWLDSEEKKLLAESDVFMSLRLGRWRAQISPFVMLTTNMMRLTFSAQQRPVETESMKVMFGWIVDGMMRFVNDMENVSIAATLGRDRVQVAHHHRFAEESPAAEYLGNIEQSRKDVLAGLPKSPFIMMGIANWNVPGEAALSVRLCRTVLNSEAMVAEVPKATRSALLESLTDCYDQILASYFVFGPATESDYPFQVMGGYFMRDAHKGIKQFHYIHEHGSELLSSMIPGAAGSGPFVSSRADGTEFFQLPLESPRMDERMRKQVTALYGKGARLEQAVVSPDHMVYCIAQPPGGITRYLKDQATAKKMRDDPRVNSIMRLLPGDAHAVALVDFKRMISALPEFMKVAGEFGPGPRPPVRITLKDNGEAGPLIGWAGVASRRAFTGRVVMERDRVKELGQIVRNLSHAMIPEGRPGHFPPQPASRQSVPPPRRR